MVKETAEILKNKELRIEVLNKNTNKDRIVITTIHKPKMQEQISQEDTIQKDGVLQDATDVDKLISEKLNKLGIPKHKAGYQYLYDAILMGYENIETIYNVDRLIYPVIAGQYFLTESAIKLSIRNVINIAWNSGDIKEEQKTFGNIIDPKRGKPTNNQFIATIVVELQLSKRHLGNNIGWKKGNSEDVAERKILDQRIAELMLILGVPANLKGYLYMHEAIYNRYNEIESDVKNVTQWRYPKIAKKYKTTAQKVEKSLLTAVKVSWEKGSIEKQKEIFGYSREEKRYPSNSEYVYSIAAYLHKTK
ncbi:MAG: sporulation initiation factor Spo0A C-terminal domain-containing protein [Clostridia bacterium]|nr:sporulation initiation factor Spo0A C-terminal domain-containing protein [Clostridia bacterium]